MRTVDRSTLAEVLSVTPGRVTQLCHAGILSKVARGLYDLNTCVQAYIEFKVSSATLQASSDVNEARKKLYDAQVIKTELETERTRRETIPADIHVTDLHAFKRITNAALDGIDDGLARDLADLSDPAAISDRMTQATNAVRTAVADDILKYSATLEGGKQ